MSLIERGRKVGDFFKGRSFVIDSPGIRSERLRDGRIMLHAKRKPVVTHAPLVLTGQVTVEGHITNGDDPTHPIIFDLTVWNKIPDSQPLTDFFQYNVNQVPPYFPLFQAFNAGGISPDSFLIIAEGDDFCQVFGRPDDLTDWHVAMRGFDQGAQFTADLTTGTFNFSIPFEHLTFEVTITYFAGNN